MNVNYFIMEEVIKARHGWIVFLIVLWLFWLLVFGFLAIKLYGATSRTALSIAILGITLALCGYIVFKEYEEDRF
jgi:hypothetical protein